MDKEKTFGKVVIITDAVIRNEKDEDLKLFNECCEHVCKIRLEIKKKKEDASLFFLNH